LLNITRAWKGISVVLWARLGSTTLKNPDRSLSVVANPTLTYKNK
jgi:hypothetical protein